MVQHVSFILRLIRRSRGVMDKAVTSLRSIFHYILTDPGSKQRQSYYLSRWHSVLASSRSRRLDLSRAQWFLSSFNAVRAWQQTTIAMGPIPAHLLISSSSCLVEVDKRSCLVSNWTIEFNDCSSSLFWCGIGCMEEVGYYGILNLL